MVKLDRTLIGLMSACALAACGSAASAAVTDLTFTATDGSGVDGSFALTTTGPNGFGAYDVTALTGSVTGGAEPGAITSYTPTPGNTGSMTSADGEFIYDNWLYSAATSAHGYVDNPGVLFDVGTTEYNLFWNNSGAGGYSLDAYNDGTLTVYNGNVSAAGGITDLPEPASWALMLMGFGGLGAAMRGARRRQTGSLAIGA